MIIDGSIFDNVITEFKKIDDIPESRLLALYKQYTDNGDVLRSRAIKKRIEAMCDDDPIVA